MSPIDFNDIKYLLINSDNFNVKSLDSFIFNQKVTECWRKTDGAYALLPVSYNERRNLAERRKTALKILNAVKDGGVAFCATYNDKIVGFVLLDDKLFGSKNQYVDLCEFYVCEGFRRHGIGKILFDKICVCAKNLGAEKLYISAHSARESIAAYKKYGCVPAREPDARHIEKEPYDLQLEFDLVCRIYEVKDKEKYSDLFLLADEQQDMVAKYLPDSTVYVLDDCGVKGEIAVTDVGNGIIEIKNLAVYPAYQRHGYGKKLIEFICDKYKDDYSVVRVGTGDSPLTLPFYEKCGFSYSHTVKNFFTDNYDHSIFEGGKQLIDMIYLSKKLK